MPSELLTWEEMAHRLREHPQSFRKSNWRRYPHTFVGQGRNLRCARFLWHDDLSHLRVEVAHVNNALSESREESLPGENKVSQPSIYKVRVQDPGGRENMDGRRKAAAKKNSWPASGDGGDKTDVLRRLRLVSGRQQSAPPTRNIHGEVTAPN